jgi:hypothetical protein
MPHKQLITYHSMTLSAQALPSSFSFRATDVVSVNGSSATGHCANVATSGGMRICAEPTTSVLFDGNIPTLTGLNGANMIWASQLFTLSSNFMRTKMTFNFHESVRINRIEVVMFHCPEWDIEIEIVQVQAPHGVLIGGKSVNISSCDSLVKVSLCNLRVTTSSLIIEFHGTQMTMAELSFYDTTTCPPDKTFTTSFIFTTSYHYT